jgi:zinc transporter ZupT
MDTASTKAGARPALARMLRPRRLAGRGVEKANPLATRISIRDVPEGLVVALALRTVGYGRGLSAALGVASGLIEPVAAVAGAVLIGVSAGLLPFAPAAYGPGLSPPAWC